MAPTLDELLDQQCVVAERRGGLTGGRVERRGKAGRLADDAHALAAAARRCLDQHGIGLRRHTFGVVLGCHRDARALGDDPSTILAAHLVHDVGGRADEDQARLDHRTGEVCPLGQEAVAGVDRLRAGLRGRRQDAWDGQVRLGGRGRPEAHSHVRGPHERSVDIGVGVDGNGA